MTAIFFFFKKSIGIFTVLDYNALA